MLILFVSLFFASILFLIFFLMNLAEDIRKRSLRPLFAILPALGFWIFCLPALLAPELSTTITTGAQITTIAASALPLRTYNAFFTLWLVMLTLILFLIAIWYLLLLQQKARDLMKEAMPLTGLEKHWGKPGG